MFVRRQTLEPTGKEHRIVARYSDGRKETLPIVFAGDVVSLEVVTFDPLFPPKGDDDDN